MSCFRNTAYTLHIKVVCQICIGQGDACCKALVNMALESKLSFFFIFFSGNLYASPSRATSSLEILSRCTSMRWLWTSSTRIRLSQNPERFALRLFFHLLFAVIPCHHDTHQCTLPLNEPSDGRESMMVMGSLSLWGKISAKIKVICLNFPQPSVIHRPLLGSLCGSFYEHGCDMHSIKILCGVVVGDIPLASSEGSGAVLRRRLAGAGRPVLELPDQHEAVQQDEAFQGRGGVVWHTAIRLQGDGDWEQPSHVCVAQFYHSHGHAWPFSPRLQSHCCMYLHIHINFLRVFASCSGRYMLFSILRVSRYSHIDTYIGTSFRAYRYYVPVGSSLGTVRQ